MLRYTLRGDADLDGAVGFSDLLVIAQHYEEVAAREWYEGDFNYSQDVNFDDLLLLSQNYDCAAAGERSAGYGFGLGGAVCWRLGSWLCWCPNRCRPRWLLARRSQSAAAVDRCGRPSRPIQNLAVD